MHYKENKARHNLGYSLAQWWLTFGPVSQMSSPGPVCTLDQAPRVSLWAPALLPSCLMHWNWILGAHHCPLLLGLDPGGLTLPFPALHAGIGHWRPGVAPAWPCALG